MPVEKVCWICETVIQETELPEAAFLYGDAALAHGKCREEFQANRKVVIESIAKGKNRGVMELDAEFLRSLGISLS